MAQSNHACPQPAGRYRPEVDRSRCEAIRLVPVLALAGLVFTGAAAAPTAWAQALAARGAEPVILSGAQLPSWSRLPSVGTAKPYPSGAEDSSGLLTPLGLADPVRDAHNGTLVVPPDVRTGVSVDEITAFRWWTETGFVEIPVQVDERFPYFLANAPSDFSFYSGTDEELTYAWDDENWKKIGGTCTTQYPPGQGPMSDPVAVLDDDDEIVFMASDAGMKAPAEAAPPLETTGTTHQEITLVDPLDPANLRYVYLFLRPSGSSAANGYVSYVRDANADEWIDKFSFRRDDFEKLGTSNGGYGPNIPGPVCVTAVDTGYPPATNPDDSVRLSSDRFPRDGVTVSTAAYKWHASGRWMIREMHVAKPGQPGVYGPDLIDRWKGRAFQSSPDSSISLVGFEDEQVNWEGNSVLLGERRGPVRAIREIWGADSGTNVTKTETFYRDAVVYRYRVRVHPIPPDGLYTSWDYNHGVAVKYYNILKPDGVDIDGVNDDVGNIDSVGSTPAFFDLTDPTFNVPLAVSNWEQVSGRDDVGSLVYLQEVKGHASLENPLVVPYYRDDKCFDDGTGDDPVPRPWPGEASADSRVIAGYGAGADCDHKQGAWAEHGVHYFLTGDTDNLFLTGKPLTEIDAQQWQFAVPTDYPHAVGQAYADAVIAPLLAVVVEVPSAD